MMTTGTTAGEVTIAAAPTTGIGTIAGVAIIAGDRPIMTTVTITAQT